MKHIIYAIQGKDLKWTGYLQKSWEANEHGDEGSVRWLDPTKHRHTDCNKNAYTERERKL